MSDVVVEAKETTADALAANGTDDLGATGNGCAA